MSMVAPAWTHRTTRTLPATPSRVFAALTMPAELRRWFADEIAVEARQDGRFAFWGRHTYGAPAAPDPRQRITRIETDGVIAFRWPLEGADSEVVMTLSPAEEDGGERKTTLTLEHRFDGKPQDTRFEDLVDDLWRLSLGNLDAHLRGGDGVVLPDYADPSPEIRLSIVIDAPPERVFQALVDPAALSAWIAASAVVEPRVGGRYSYGWSYRHGDREVEGGPTRILDLVPNERLVTDWPDWRGDPTKPKTRVAWLLEPVGSKTRVTVVHGEFPRTVDISDYPFGWASFLERLKGIIEGGRS
jgi:uncharacterized protein YndB with AHSA1/START domain